MKIFELERREVFSKSIYSKNNEMCNQKSLLERYFNMLLITYRYYPNIVNIIKKKHVLLFYSIYRYT